MLESLSVPSITDAEWEIMRIVWANQSLTSRQIIDIASQFSDWKEATIKTLINRLLQKDHLILKGDQKPYHYQANISEKEAVQAEINNLMDRICNKDKASFIYQVINEATLSQADCEQLIKKLQHKSVKAPMEVKCNCPVGQCQCHIQSH
ncbi:CopY/TcrY family copper transport repressor [Facklamia sp. 7083-14-GEN3]|uniref:CopY/TcrY family copper transport repressor n=1 Tax=Facklamia sp. 7083-14-GEN3 TaxID=2973478 RepID=UPI00215D302E|nr:CopY/TcrY family copper transport repressor [Facklamia sp. 7083-14-GEN3]MCR8969750.1 CopY/TcrY family copper transport repressor [Facklamia sp. 7083-14-GEN3]